MASSDRLQLQGGRLRHCCSASANGLRKFETARTRVLSVALLLLLLQFMFTMAAGWSCPGKIGVDIALYGSEVLPPNEIVRLLQVHDISRARLYDANVTILRAFANSGIDLIVSVPNEEVPTVARSPVAARSWVADHIVPFGAANISAILVGYQWLSNTSLDPTLLLPAVRNVNAALGFLWLTSREIRVSTSISMDLLSRPAWVFPPSLATFKPSLTPILRPLVNFLGETDSFIDVSISPFDAYVKDPSVSLKFVLFESTRPIRDNNTGLEYYNMFDVEVDAVESALQALQCSLTALAITPPVAPPPSHPNSGWRSRPNYNPYSSRPNYNPYSNGDTGLWLDDQIARREQTAATIANARMYNQNLINYVTTKEGTPRYPSEKITAYIFELFNEPETFGPDTEKYMGLFYPNGTSVYDIDFCGTHL